MVQSSSLGPAAASPKDAGRRALQRDGPGWEPVHQGVIWEVESRAPASPRRFCPARRHQLSEMKTVFARCRPAA